MTDDTSPYGVHPASEIVAALERVERADDERLDYEFAFAHQHHTSYTCSDIYDARTECKRARGHEGPHAAGFGKGRKRWAA